MATRPVYQIVLIAPQGFIHAEALREVMEAFQQGFRDLGFDVPIRINECDTDTTPIVFGAQHVKSRAKLPPGAIVYNAEQLIDGFPWATDDYLALLARYPVWDFNACNVRRLAQLNRKQPLHHVPVAYAPTLTRIAPQNEDIDVLFLGRLSERRRRTLSAIEHAGLKVRAVNNLYGPARDEFIARSKVVVNIHVADNALFESARVVYLLANRKAVVCESSHPEDIEADLRGSVIPTQYQDLPEACIAAVKDESARQAIAEAGFNAVRAPGRRASNILRRVLA